MKFSDGESEILNFPYMNSPDHNRMTLQWSDARPYASDKKRADSIENLKFLCYFMTF